MQMVFPCCGNSRECSYTTFSFFMCLLAFTVLASEMSVKWRNGPWPDGLTLFSIRRLKGHSIGALLKQLQPDGDLGGNHPASDRSPKESGNDVQKNLEEGKDR